MGKTCLVTGGAGFIGAHLCGRLVREGHTVISLDNYFTGSKSNHVPGVEYRRGHTKDIEKHVPESPDVVFHLGEYSRVEVSLEEPELVHDLNIAGTFGVVEFWRKKGPKLVYAGSSTKMSTGGEFLSPYTLTKAHNTRLVRAYADWYGLRYATAYFYNVYGPGERAGRYGTLVEIFRGQRERGEPLTVVSPGTQKRIFTHVEDIVSGLVLLADRGSGDGFGLGAMDEFSVLEVASMFGGPVCMLPSREGNRMDVNIDRTAALLLGWYPERVLREYIGWALGAMGRGSDASAFGL